MHNLGVVRLKDLVSLDLDEVVEEVLNVVREVSTEFFDRLASLHDLLDFLPREEVLHIHLLRHDLLPNVDHAHSEREGKVDQKDGCAELEQAEVLQVQVEQVALGLLSFVRSLL